MPTSAIDKRFEVAYLKNDLEISIINRNIDSSFDALRLFPYYEDGESDEEGEKKGVLDKISNLINTLVQKVEELIQRFVRFITGIGKDHITSDDYYNSEKGKADFNDRAAEIMRSTDEVFAQQRPIVSAISNVTTMDPVAVSNACDLTNRVLAKVKWDKIGTLAVNHVAMKRAMKKYSDNISANNKAIKAANKELRSGRKEIKQKEKKLKAVSKAAQTNASIASKLFGWAD
jgi:hypothetical protein